MGCSSAGACERRCRAEGSDHATGFTWSEGARARRRRATGSTRKEKPPRTSAFANALGGFRWSGRLDLNQRPLAPQSRLHGESPSAESSNGSPLLGNSDSARPMLSPDLANIRSKVNAPVMQEIKTESACPCLLTVKEVAARLRTSTATVYGLCDRGELAYVRVSTHAIRVDERDLAAFARGGRYNEGRGPRG